MNFGEMEAALNEAVTDDDLALGFGQNLNDTILELAADFENLRPCVSWTPSL